MIDDSKLIIEILGKDMILSLYDSIDNDSIIEI